MALEMLSGSVLQSMVGTYNLPQFVKDEIKLLKSKHRAILNVLEDAEGKQFANLPAEFHNRLLKLKDASYMLDDFLDEWSIEAIREEGEGVPYCAFLSLPRKYGFYLTTSQRIEVVKRRLDLIPQEDQRSSSQYVSHCNIQHRRSTTSIGEHLCYGREQEKEVLVRCLLQNAGTKNQLPVYPIVGMAGLGKTLLAQLVYNDVRVENHFYPRIWVCVSQDFNLETLIKSIIASANGSEVPYPSAGNLMELAEELQNTLKGKRYLLVLDDMWNDDPAKWYKLRHLISCGSEGSAILTTTRQKIVAATMCIPPIKPYHLSELPEADCWEIFRTYAFGFTERENQHLVAIGKQISEKCKGVPLAAKNLGTLLRFMTEEREWLKFNDYELWDVLPGEDSVFASLRLSYFNLSPRVRRCFSCLAIFPKNCKIEKEGLIHVWAANGLISSEKMFEVGEEILNELHWRSLIQDMETDEFGNICCFKLHDLVHGLLRTIMADECFVAKTSALINLPPRTRHLSIDYECASSDDSFSLDKVESLRTLIYFHPVHPSTLFTSDSLERTRLRALDLSMIRELRVLPSSIRVLKHLKYLNLSDAEIEELPEMICDLWNLHILNLSRCTRLKSLPNSMGRMKSLQHLYMTGCLSLHSLPKDIGRVTSLRTFNYVIVGESEKLDFQLCELGNFKHLRGELEVTHLERVREENHAEEANLTSKQKLDRLNLSWENKGDGVRDDDGGRDERQNQLEMLESLRPPPKLKYLEVRGYRVASFPHWMMNQIASFRNMQSVLFSSCKNCTRLPPLWRLPSLRRLQLEHLDSLPYLMEVGDGDHTFQSLETLILSSLPTLASLICKPKSKQDINHSTVFPQLSKVVISECHELNSSTLLSIQSLKSCCVDNVELKESGGSRSRSSLLFQGSCSSEIRSNRREGTSGCLD